MRIAIAQINSTIGDFSGNKEKILDFTRRAKNEEADLILFPELALCGSPLLDLFEYNEFIESNIRTLEALKQELPEDLAVGLGYLNRDPSGKPLKAYGFIQGRRLLLEIFNEAQFFEFKGQRIAVAIGEEAFFGIDPTHELLDHRISILCAPSASPFTLGGMKTFRERALEISRQSDLPLVYVNAVGANDSVIYPGLSFIANSDSILLEAKAFEEDLVLWDFPEKREKRKEKRQENSGFFTSHFSLLTSHYFDELEEALVLGIRDYMRKCGFRRVHLGLSGGLDSALVACLAVKAAGPENTFCINMPSRFSSQGSKDDSRELAENLGCRYEVLPIEDIFISSLSTLEGIFENRPFDVAEENLQSRIRGLLCMAYANKFNSMLLAGGNKSEFAMGYCTLYGDTNGALAPIGDVFKTEAFALCRRINERSLSVTGKALIPQAIIDKPPSAELRPDQTDQDSLPPYEELDQILRLLLCEKMALESIVERGWDRELVSRIIRTVARSEWKRRQCPPVLIVSKYAFGLSRNMPLARELHEI